MSPGDTFEAQKGTMADYIGLVTGTILSNNTVKTSVKTDMTEINGAVTAILITVIAGLVPPVPPP